MKSCDCLKKHCFPLSSNLFNNQVLEPLHMIHAVRVLLNKLGSQESLQ